MSRFILKEEEPHSDEQDTTEQRRPDGTLSNVIDQYPGVQLENGPNAATTSFSDGFPMGAHITPCGCANFSWLPHQPDGALHQHHACNFMHSPVLAGVPHFHPGGVYSVPIFYPYPPGTHFVQPQSAPLYGMQACQVTLKISILHQAEFSEGQSYIWGLHAGRWTFGARRRPKVPGRCIQHKRKLSWFWNLANCVVYISVSTIKIHRYHISPSVLPSTARHQLAPTSFYRQACMAWWGDTAI